MLFVPAFMLAMAAGGLVDVVMNIVAADALAHEAGRLVRFHGLFNAGCVAGAAVTGIALRFGASWRVVWVGIAVVGVTTGLVTRRARLPEPERFDHPSMWRALAGLRHEGLVVLAVVFGASAMVEGGIATWGILYLRSNLGLGVLAGVSAYVVGESLATFARLGGGPMVGALGTRRAVVFGATLAAAGIATEALCGMAGIAAAGLAAAAVGISVVWPLLLADVNNEAAPSRAGNRRDHRVRVPRDGCRARRSSERCRGCSDCGPDSLVLAGIALFVALVPAHVRAPTAVAVRNRRRSGVIASGQEDVAERAPQQRGLRVERLRERCACFGCGGRDQRRGLRRDRDSTTGIRRPVLRRSARLRLRDRGSGDRAPRPD